MSDANETETDAATGAVGVPGARAAKRRNAKAKFDAATGIVTITPIGGEAENFDFNELPAETVKSLAVRGFQAFLVANSSDLGEAFHRLMSGDFIAKRGRKPGAASKALNAWRMAMAHASVEETKKSDNPLTLEQAIEFARDLPKESVAEAKTMPIVVKHYNKLNPKKDVNGIGVSLTSLFAKGAVKAEAAAA